MNELLQHIEPIIAGIVLGTIAFVMLMERKHAKH